MELVQRRFSTGEHSTLSTLHWHRDMVDFVFLCFVLEDPPQEEKIAGETRIPAGVYPLLLRNFGGFHERYSKRFPKIHRGMIELAGVLEFTDVLMHCGNDPEDTRGCLLLGDGATQNVTGTGRVMSSTSAYERVYQQIAEAITAGGAVLTIADYA